MRPRAMQRRSLRRPQEGPVRFQTGSSRCWRRCGAGASRTCEAYLLPAHQPAAARRVPIAPRHRYSAIVERTMISSSTISRRNETRRDDFTRRAGPPPARLRLRPSENGGCWYLSLRGCEGEELGSDVLRAAQRNRSRCQLLDFSAGQHSRGFRIRPEMFSTMDQQQLGETRSGAVDSTLDHPQRNHRSVRFLHTIDHPRPRE